MKTKILAIILAAAMVFGLTACADTRTALTVEGIEIRAGEYIRAQITAAQKGAIQFREENPDVDVSASNFDYFAQTLDGKSFGDWVNEEALILIKERIAYFLLYEELGLELTEFDRQEAAQYTEQVWDDTQEVSAMGLSFKTTGDFFESIGIGKESNAAVILYDIMADEVFLNIYGRGGTEEVPEEVVTELYKQDYARFTMLEVPLVNLASGEPITDTEELDSLEELAYGYAQRLRNGERFSVVYNDYYEDLTAIYEAALAGDEEPNETEEVEEEAEETEEHEEEPEETEELEEFDPSAEEDHDHDSYDQELLEKKGQPSYMSEEASEFLFDMSEGEVSCFKTEDAWLVLNRLDITERTDWLYQMWDNLLFELKGDELRDKVKAKAASLTITVNQAAIKRYKPETAAKKELL